MGSDERPDDGEATSDAALGQALRRLIAVVDGADALMPREERSQLLTSIVSTAMRVVSAAAGSLFLLDPDQRHLDFEVALGPKAGEVSKFRVPIGHGIAGTVAATGIPIAISAPERDPRFAVEIATDIGHVPQSILCVPMRSGDAIIGVLEMLDKIDRDTFSAADIELLGYFADIAAMATEQVRHRDDLRLAINVVLRSWVTADDETLRNQVAEGLDNVLYTSRVTDEYRATLRIARLISEISESGPAERDLCYRWIDAFRDYLQQKSQTGISGFPWLQ
jgi:GAF domain-containing protein